MAVLSSFALRITPGKPLDVVKNDPDDNKIVECAVAVGSDYLVTGDKHLLSMGQYEGIRMIKVADFLSILQGRSRVR